jgi:hypothetical protein
MTHPDGAFCASLDADSEGAEGKFYVWTWEELTRILGPEDAAFFGELYGAAPTGNWSDDHFGTVTVLNRLDAKHTTLQEEARLATTRQKLFEARERRVHPALDDKILADWNGLMIAALVNAATLLNEPKWVGLAARAYDFIVAAMRYVDADRRVRLAHSWRAGVLVRPGMALDYAAMIRAALALHEARNWSALPSILDRNYLSDAISWAETLDTCHLDGQSGLLCMAATDATDVILRLSPTADDAIPNAHPVYLSALVRLAGLSGDDRWLKRADELLEALRPAAMANPVAHAGTLNAFDSRLRAKQVVIVGPKRQELYEAALCAPFVERIVMDIDQPAAIPATVAGQAQAILAGDGAAFVCAGGTCSLPLRSAQALLDALVSTDAKAPEK